MWNAQRLVQMLYLRMGLCSFINWFFVEGDLQKTFIVPLITYLICQKNRKWGKELSDRKTIINGEIFVGHPLSITDITSHKTSLNKCVESLFQHQIHLIDCNVKHLLVVCILRWEHQFEQVVSINPLSKQGKANHIFISSWEFGLCTIGMKY